MTALMFWNDASGEYKGEVDAKLPARKFPSKDMVHYFHPMAWVRQMKLMYYKPDIDLRPLMTFESQGKGPSCNTYCRKILTQLGLTPHGSNKTLQLGVESENGIVIDKIVTKKAISYIDRALEFGHPIMVGIDHTFEYRSFGVINEGTTDHYVVIVGRKYIDGKQFYIYWDVGTRRGASTEWKFEYRDNRLIADKTYKQGNMPFTVTQVRKNLGYEYN